MAEVEEARQTIVKIFRQYHKTTSGCQTLPELAEPTLLMMQQVCDIVMPDHVVKLL